MHFYSPVSAGSAAVTDDYSTNRPVHSWALRIATTGVAPRSREKHRSDLAKVQRSKQGSEAKVLRLTQPGSLPGTGNWTVLQ